jgi:hypothetical protein
MTPEEVRIALSLRPFDEFARASGETTRLQMLSMMTEEQVRAEGPRRTGRTTRMIVEALAAASLGRHVVFVSRSLESARTILKYAQEFAHRLGIPINLFQAAASSRSANQNTRNTVFTDHTVADVIAMRGEQVAARRRERAQQATPARPRLNRFKRLLARP